MSELAIDKEWGDFIMKRRPYSLAEERLIARMIQRNGPAKDRAIELLCEANMAYALSHCTRWSKLVSVDLLFSYALEGLIEAAKRFQPRGKFSPYAKHWIKAYVYRGVAENWRSASVPYNTISKLPKYNEFYAGFYEEHRTDPNVEEIGSVYEEGWVADAIFFLRGTRWKSMDETLSHDPESKGRTYAEVFPGEDNTEDLVLDRNLRDMVESIFDEYWKWRSVRTAHKTKERDIEIVRKLFGIGGTHYESYEEIGDEYGLSRERIRQIKEEFIQTIQTSGSFAWARNEMKNIFPGSEISNASAAVVPAHRKRTTSRASST